MLKEEGEQKPKVFLILQSAAGAEGDTHLNYSKPRMPPNPIKISVCPEISSGDKGMLLMQ